MEYVTPKYEKQLQDLAESLVTPERFGARLVLVHSVEVAEENLAGLWD